ncbi:MAG: glycosyltransferase, partial [Chromatiales bacterium]|nr:glycosyltransferase [Chromatiales bacterium]
MFKATVIISVYRDVEALEVILYALEQQSEKSFSVVVSEDGESVEVKEYLSRRNSPLAIQHLTQEDKGFRKNRALNRAVLAAPGETLIFIDGDCVPHPKFVESHLKYAMKGVVNCGRRVNLGPEFSRILRDNPSRLSELTSVWRYISHFLDFRRDGIRNYELGFYVPKIQTLM